MDLEIFSPRASELLPINAGMLSGIMNDDIRDTISSITPFSASYIRALEPFRVEKTPQTRLQFDIMWQK